MEHSDSVIKSEKVAAVMLATFFVMYNNLKITEIKSVKEIIELEKECLQPFLKENAYRSTIISLSVNKWRDIACLDWFTDTY